MQTFSRLCCQPHLLPYKGARFAQWAAGASLRSTVITCPLSCALWMSRSSLSVNITTTTESQTTWCAPALLWAVKTPARWIRAAGFYSETQRGKETICIQNPFLIKQTVSYKTWWHCALFGCRATLAGLLSVMVILRGSCPGASVVPTSISQESTPKSATTSLGSTG